MKVFLMAAAALTLASTAFAQQEVFIRSLNFNGTGCDPFSARGQLYDVNRDGLPEQFQILFSSYTAEQGPNVLPAQRRKNCNITVQLRLPQGYQFSIGEVRYLGYADLPGSVRGRQLSTYEFPFQGSPPVSFQTVLVGPFSDNYERTDRVGIESLVWSRCGTEAPLNIRTEVRLEGNRAPSALLSTDQIDGFVKQIYGLTWRRCR